MNSRVALKRRIVVALLVTLIAGVTYAVYTLRVEEIRVTGVRTLDPKQVIQASGLVGGERILWIRLSSVARRIERLPAVASATAERSFPQTVVIRVTERIPLAQLGGTRRLAVDRDGRIFATSVGSLPVVEGWRAEARPGRSLDRASTRVLQAFGTFPHPLRRRTARITIGPPMTLVLTDGVEVRFGVHLDLERKARVAEAVLEAEAGRDLAYVDVRAPGVPVSREREPPTPAPTAPPTPAQPSTPATPTATPATPTTPAP
jgi:cell division protein FtsQ